MEKVRTVTEDDRCAIQEKFLQLHNDLMRSSSDTMAVPSGVASGLTNEIIFKIICHLRFIDSPMDVI